MKRNDAPAVSATAMIRASPGEVYGIIADYRGGHARILPRPPFVSLEVEEGGVGEGTRIRVRMRLLGRETAYRATVSEPEPGRLLAEANENGYVTRFIVEPAGADRSRVTIETRTPPRPAGLAAVERWFLRRMLREVYRRELALLEEAASGGRNP
jgi:Polyketide cyclase / dehydrase and lipid transport